jgi:hypothetical protein
LGGRRAARAEGVAVTEAIANEGAMFREVFDISLTANLCSDYVLIPPQRAHGQPCETDENSAVTDPIVNFLLVVAGVILFMVGVAWMILRAIFPSGGSGFLAGLLLGWIAGRQRPAQVVVRGAIEHSPVIQAERRRPLRWLWIILGGLALYAIARHEARADQVFKPTREAARAEGVSIAKA